MTRTDPLDELLDTARFPRRADVEDHLLGRLLPAAYVHQPGDPSPPCNLEQAQRWLGHLAYRMHLDNTRDLAWWRLPQWTPVWQRLLLGGLVSGTLSGILLAVLGGGLGGASLPRFVGGLMIGVVAATFEVLVVKRSENRERRAMRRRVGTGYVLANLLAGLLAGISLGGPVDGALVGLVAGLGVGLVIAFPGVQWLTRALGANSRPAAAVGTHLTPVACWRQDRRHALMFVLLLAFTVAAALGVTCLLLGEPVTRVVGAIALELVFVPTAAISLSLRAYTTRAALQLWLQGRGPLRLIPFLEDARRRNVLRTAGPVYQFRHARVQDVLARWYAEDQGLPYHPPAG